MNRDQLKIPVNKSAVVSLIFDSPKIGESNGKAWRLYAVNHQGVEKSFFASEKAHEMLQHYTKGDCVLIEHKPMSDGKSVYNVTPASYNDESIDQLDKKDSTDLNIKWGMAFNNTTRLVSSVPLHADETINDRVELIETLMPKMFRIARNMDEVLKQEKLEEPF